MTRSATADAKGIAIFVAASAVAMGIVGGLLAAVFTSPVARRSLLVSALLAMVVQLMAFVLVRRARPAQQFAAHTAGALLRFATLLVYALVFLKPLALLPAAALISLAAFFFVSMLLEPRLLSV